jgi:hypothetical protein
MKSFKGAPRGTPCVHENSAKRTRIWDHPQLLCIGLGSSSLRRGPRSLARSWGPGNEPILADGPAQIVPVVPLSLGMCQTRARCRSSPSRPRTCSTAGTCRTKSCRRRLHLGLGDVGRLGLSEQVSYVLEAHTMLDWRNFLRRASDLTVSERSALVSSLPTSLAALPTSAAHPAKSSTPARTMPANILRMPFACSP